MEITPYSPILLPGLAKLANASLEQVPPGWVLSEEQVGNILRWDSRIWRFHYPEEEAPDHIQTVCTVEGDRLLAAAQWFVWNTKQEGVLSWIFANPDHPAAVQPLITHLLEHARRLGCRRLYTTRFAFGAGWLGFPTLWTPIHLGLAESGFTSCSRWQIYFGEPDLPLAALPAGLQIPRLEWSASPESLEWELKLHDGNTLVGECEAWGIPPHFAGCPGYEQWMTIEWLGVEEPFRGRGFGGWLLAEMVRRQSSRGIRRFICWTGVENTAARRLLKSAGFHPGPECWEYIWKNQGK